MPNTRYIEFVDDLKTLCHRYGLVFGGGGNTETGEMRFGFRPGKPDDVESHDYIHNNGLVVRQLENGDPSPPVWGQTH